MNIKNTFINTSPSVCICIPTYNSSKTISDTLESVIKQNYPDIKVFVVDNASSDETLKIVRKYAAIYTWIKIYDFEENVGGEGNFNRCIQLAEGDYTAIFHSDDVYEATIIEKQVALLERYPDVGAVFTAGLNIDEEGTVISNRTFPKEVLKSKKEVFTFEDLFPLILKYSNFLICSSAMVRTEIYKKDIKIWNGERYATSADLDVWFRILKKHRIGIIKEPFIKYRMSDSSFSYNLARQRTVKHDLFLVLDDYIQGYAKEKLTKRDKINYQLLQLKDDINRAIVYLLKNRNQEAKCLLKGLFHFRNITESFRSRIHFRYLIIGYITFFLTVFPIGDFGRKMLYKIRYGK